MEKTNSSLIILRFWESGKNIISRMKDGKIVILTGKKGEKVAGQHAVQLTQSKKGDCYLALLLGQDVVKIDDASRLAKAFGLPAHAPEGYKKVTFLAREGVGHINALQPLVPVAETTEETSTPPLVPKSSGEEEPVPEIREINIWHTCNLKGAKKMLYPKEWRAAKGRETVRYRVGEGVGQIYKKFVLVPY
ncbi:hypothetical protein JW899_05025 [Candidatus Uhrbacteria bacterium]|nr:hypothetical protein [Candidatus Uhrbacteria bacterium]